MSRREANTHENLSRSHEIQGSTDRSFGLVFAAFFTLLALAPLRRHLPVRLWSLVLAAVLLLLALFRPVWLHLLNRAWTQLGLALAKIVTPVVMGAMFYLVFTPAALLLRLLGKDPLNLAVDKAAASYWIERRPPGPPGDSMANQF